MKKLIIIIIPFLILFIAGCTVTNSAVAEVKGMPDTIENQEEKPMENDKDKEASVIKEEDSSSIFSGIIPDYGNSRYKEIYLAGGCFWGIQAYIDQIYGIEYTNVGYANGNSIETDYYSIKETGHAETVYVVYDPQKITLEELLGYYYGIIDPTSINKQGNDTGTQYRSGIYYIDESDKKIIEMVTGEEQAKYSEEIATEIQPLKNYVLAEDYHQDYLDNNPYGYCHIDLNSIPKKKPKVILGDYPRPPIEEIKERLTDLQFRITQENATEYAFQNEYWDNKETGIYIDIVTGEPLFLSLNKFDSGTGWPSFTRPIQWNVITYNIDESVGMERIEVRSRSGDSHLGHMFYDGPVAEGGLRYCINSGALDFLSYDNLEEQGYGKFKSLFE
jgi:peptide methionine sulfoxide reductase msrA/msrB